MNGPVWYYAQGESEKGPLTTSQIKALAAAGKLRREDFVWKEGMESWAPARDVSELFAAEPKPHAASQAPKARDKRATRTAPAPAVSDTRKSSPPRSPAGQTILAFGLLVVLMSRGCDSLGQRHVDRLQAIAEAGPRRFDEEWQRGRRPLEDELRALGDQPNPPPARLQQINSLTRQLAELDEQMRNRQRQLSEGDWRLRQTAAREAEDESRVWGFWREAAFLAGTIILAAGLLGVAFTAEGPDRWICLVMLAAILFSVYLNDPWNG